MADAILTEGNNTLTTEGGGHIVVETSTLVAVNYDFIAAIEAAAPGVVIQRANLDAVSAAWLANNQVALSTAAIVALVGPLPAYPTGMKRFPDSNPAPDGWSIVQNDTVVTGGVG